MVFKSVSLQLRTTVCDSLARRIALSGLTSEKVAESAIKQGEVEVDGQIIKKNIQIHSEANIRYKGRIVPTDIQTRLWAVNKPKNVLCSLTSGSNAVSLQDFMRLKHEKNEEMGDIPNLRLPLYSNIVKRLDTRYNGLVLLTNDSIFAKRLANTDSKIQSVYKMKVLGAMPPDFLKSIRNGAIINGFDYGPVRVDVVKRGFRTTWIRIQLVEQPGGCLDSLLGYFNLQILKSACVAFGPVRLESLPNDGQVTPLPIPSIFRQFVPVAEQKFCMIPTSEVLGDFSEVASVFDLLKKKSAVKISN